jgi:endonuclease YncB( thermonuclease family)
VPNALSTTKQGFIVGRAFIAKGKSLKQAVHDGDTVSISPNTFLNTRLLGVDTPEVSFSLPGEKTFPSIGGGRWKAFLDDPFAAAPTLPSFSPALPAALRAHLDKCVGPGCADNHFAHAKAAETQLQDLITADITAAGIPADQFGLFLAFAHEVIDRYGRFLSFLHRDDRTVKPRPYNEQLLATGVAVPYFIWPNIVPFVRDRRVPQPGAPIRGTHLDAARQAVATARQNQIGIFEPGNPLRLLPFELRYLARTMSGPNPSRPGPDRWVIDIPAGTSQLLPPHRYIEIPNTEDRLFVNEEHVPLFVEHGWQKQP